MKLLQRKSIEELAVSYVEMLEKVQAGRFDAIMRSAGPLLSDPMVPPALRERAIRAIDAMAAKALAVVAKSRWKEN